MRHALLLLFAVTLSACLGDSTGPGEGGAFSVTVSGDIVGSFEGTSVFAAQRGYGFSLLLTSEDNRHIVAFARAESARPGPGRHTIVATEEAAQAAFLVAYARHGQEALHVVSTDGTLDITSSTSRRLQGSFTLAARGHLLDDPDTEVVLTMTGSFDATCAGVSSSMCN